MSFTTKSAFLCIALVLVSLAAFSPKADAQLVVNGTVLNTIVINGTVLCSPTVTGPCITPLFTCAPLSNLNVGVTLKGTQIASTTTDPNGSFRVNISVPNNITCLVDLLGLRVVIPLPIGGCSLFASTSTGSLVGTPVLPLVGGIGGPVVNMVVPIMTIVV